MRQEGNNIDMEYIPAAVLGAEKVKEWRRSGMFLGKALFSCPLWKSGWRRAERAVGVLAVSWVVFGRRGDMIRFLSLIVFVSRICTLSPLAILNKSPTRETSRPNHSTWIPQAPHLRCQFNTKQNPIQFSPPHSHHPRIRSPQSSLCIPIISSPPVKVQTTPNWRHANASLYMQIMLTKSCQCDNEHGFDPSHVFATMMMTTKTRRWWDSMGENGQRFNFEFCSSPTIFPLLLSLFLGRWGLCEAGKWW